MQENVLQKMVVWKYHATITNESGYVIDKEKSLIIEETVIDLNKKQNIYFNGQHENYNYISELGSKAFDECRANKLIFRKNYTHKIR